MTSIATFPSYNRVLLVGELTGRPQLTKNANNQSSSSFQIRVLEVRPAKEEAAREKLTVVPLVCFGNLADECHRLRAGKILMIEGRLHIYEPKGGTGRLEVIADRITLMPNAHTTES